MNVRLLIMLFIIVPASINAQRTDRDYVRKGNKFFNDSLYVKAEEDYLKALDKNSASIEASYNLGNTYFGEQKGQEAAEQFQKAITVLELEKDKIFGSSKSSDKEKEEIRNKTALAYHNLGTLFQASQNYAPAIAAYKEALKNNPTDHETRYNLALAMHQLKRQQEQSQDQDQQNQQNQQEQQNQQDKQQQNQQDQQNQENQQPEQQENQNDMSRENAEQLLQAAMQDEKDVQERVQQMMQVQPKGQLDKDW